MVVPTGSSELNNDGQVVFFANPDFVVWRVVILVVLFGLGFGSGVFFAPTIFQIEATTLGLVNSVLFLALATLVWCAYAAGTRVVRVVPLRDAWGLEVISGIRRRVVSNNEIRVEKGIDRRGGLCVIVYHDSRRLFPLCTVSAMGAWLDVQFWTSLCKGHAKTVPRT